VLTYEIPDWAKGDVRPGTRVVVPFRNSHTVGVVVSLTDKSDVKRIRAISACPDDAPVFSEKLVELVRWLYDYYVCSPGDAFRAALPGGLGYDVDRFIVLKKDGDSSSMPKKSRIMMELLRQKFRVTEDWLKEKVGARGFTSALEELISMGMAGIALEIKANRKPRTQTIVSSVLNAEQLREEIENLPGNAYKQRELLEYFIDNMKEHPKRHLSALFGAGPVKAAIDKGWAEAFEEEVIRDIDSMDVVAPTPENIVLTKAQAEALKEIVGDIARADTRHRSYGGLPEAGRLRFISTRQNMLENPAKGCWCWFRRLL